MDVTDFIDRVIELARASPEMEPYKGQPVFIETHMPHDEPVLRFIVSHEELKSFGSLNISPTQLRYQDSWEATIADTVRRLVRLMQQVCSPRSFTA